ncbi:DUF2442 domain-containing protein [Streptococcus suis]|uniref:DUF2442 domain-containing protein n=1 Tax=Streptococcus suis TaxID=1307 RepID=UPI001ABE3A6A|nr:DUF2442 domain-containing protein [Streptococcus suis]MBO4108659.1 DUF2442 domain-containing protein [Streptococcus suis]HEM3629031.1 DUF2442 domain-containing protein [Streptococcus suis]
MTQSVIATSVKPLAGLRILTTFMDGKQTIYDCNQDIKTIKAFQKLTIPDEFEKVYLAYGGRSIAWGDGNEFEDPTMDSEVPYSEGLELER